eukprot:Gregarina_sp_Poly_1__5316@NODE_2810_length_1688_cov_126_537323_g1697_i1_p1_GENE_NODE_2810_length_1688_cov_126_537323_g1697_i1NODE_2810_length_1688_cov_126_537323_g1697_i1_p1_ORF_typecomplete_len509_score67_48_NODE_2810_length_1688_cov_126_537323_g1697_i1881614
MRASFLVLVAFSLSLSGGLRPFPFYGSDENKIRLAPYSERKALAPRLNWTTPAAAALAYVNPETKAWVVYDRLDKPSGDRVRRSLFRQLDEKFSVDGNFDSEVQTWITVFESFMEIFRREFEDKGIMRFASNGTRSPEVPDATLVDKFSMAIPATSDRLWKASPSLLSLQCAKFLPQDLAMSISPPQNKDDYVALRGFLRILPKYIDGLPSRFGVKMIVHSEVAYRQWGNRWLAANHTTPLSEWVMFWDADDFMHPLRVDWYDIVVTERPEIDLLLGGKEMKAGSVSVLAAFAAKSVVRRNNDTEAIKKLNEEPAVLYGDVLKSMCKHCLREWQIGSVYGAPLATGKQYFLKEILNATVDALEDPKYSKEQLRLIRREIHFMESMYDKNNTDGVYFDRYAADGWSTIRRDLLSFIPPPTIAKWGEDSLYNWMIAASGFNYCHLVPPFVWLKSGAYLQWPKRNETWRLHPTSVSKTIRSYLWSSSARCGVAGSVLLWFVCSSLLFFGRC